MIAIGVPVLAVLIAVGGYTYHSVKQSNDYDHAMSAYESGDFQQAYNGFEALGDYQNSISMMASAKLGIDYNDAIALFDAADFEKAKAMFQELESKNYAGAPDWLPKCDYAMADKLFNEGDLYGAYQAFLALGAYQDAVERTQACTTPYPESGELYHNEAYYSSASRITIDGANTAVPNYFKIYIGEVLVSTIFIKAAGSASIDVPAGDYTIKQASGSTWFGETIMFGDEGSYQVLLFEDGGTSTRVDDNTLLTLTLQVYDGNTGTDMTNRNNF